MGLLRLKFSGLGLLEGSLLLRASRGRRLLSRLNIRPSIVCVVSLVIITFFADVAFTGLYK